MQKYKYYEMITKNGEKGEYRENENGGVQWLNNTEWVDSAYEDIELLRNTVWAFDGCFREVHKCECETKCAECEARRSGL